MSIRPQNAGTPRLATPEEREHVLQLFKQRAASGAVVQPPPPPPMQPTRANILSLPQEFLDVIKPDDQYLQGERFYWDGGLRNQLIEQGREGYWVAVRGEKFVIAEADVACVDLAVQEFQTRSFYCVQVNKEFVSGKTCLMTRTAYGLKLQLLSADIAPLNSFHFFITNVRGICGSTLCFRHPGIFVNVDTYVVQTDIYIVHGNTERILGRDVTNMFHCLRDGPRLEETIF